MSDLDMLDMCVRYIAERHALLNQEQVDILNRAWSLYEVSDGEDQQQQEQQPVESILNIHHCANWPKSLVRQLLQALKPRLDIEQLSYTQMLILLAYNLDFTNVERFIENTPADIAQTHPYLNRAAKALLTGVRN
jgi:hypothetical protein